MVKCLIIWWMNFVLKQKDELLSFSSTWTHFLWLGLSSAGRPLIHNDNCASFCLTRIRCTSRLPAVTAAESQQCLFWCRSSATKWNSWSQFELQLRDAVSPPTAPRPPHSVRVIHKPHAHPHATGASVSQVMIWRFFFSHSWEIKEAVWLQGL